MHFLNFLPIIKQNVDKICPKNFSALLIFIIYQCLKSKWLQFVSPQKKKKTQLFMKVYTSANESYQRRNMRCIGKQWHSRVFVRTNNLQPITWGLWRKVPRHKYVKVFHVQRFNLITSISEGLRSGFIGAIKVLCSDSSKHPLVSLAHIYVKSWEMLTYAQFTLGRWFFAILLKLVEQLIPLFVFHSFIH